MKKQVSKQEFYNIINDLDICVHSTMNSITKIMTTKFTYRDGRLFGYSYHNYDLESDSYGEITYEIV